MVVLEREPEIGGRAAQIRARGFTFDVGPSLITMPRLLEELFELAGVRLWDRLRMHRLDPFYRISWHDETRSFLFDQALQRVHVIWQHKGRIEAVATA